MTSREDAVEALFRLLQANGAFATATRRNRAPKSFLPGQTPALVLVEHSEEYLQSALSQPVRSLYVTALIYFDCGTDENVIPGQTINAGLDAFDLALAPDDISGRCTLGGLVFVAMIEGKIIRAPGDITGKSVAVVPIRLILDSP